MEQAETKQGQSRNILLCEAFNFYYKSLFLAEEVLLLAKFTVTAQYAPL